MTEYKFFKSFDALNFDICLLDPTGYDVKGDAIAGQFPAVVKSRRRGKAHRDPNAPKKSKS